VLQARGDLEEAAQCHREALKIDPDYTEAQESLEDVLKTLDLRRRRGRA
jgi:tetratricopeptide (TPR) repeat protein